VVADFASLLPAARLLSSYQLEGGLPALLRQLPPRCIGCDFSVVASAHGRPADFDEALAALQKEASLQK
jgi:hypothetical protein